MAMIIHDAQEKGNSWSKFQLMLRNGENATHSGEFRIQEKSLVKGRKTDSIL